MAEEVNVKSIEYKKSSKAEPEVELDTKITPNLRQEGEARELIRQIQQLRKEQDMTLEDKTKIIAPSWPSSLEKMILIGTTSTSIIKGDRLKVMKVEDEDSKRH